MDGWRVVKGSEYVLDGRYISRAFCDSESAISFGLSEHFFLCGSGHLPVIPSASPWAVQISTKQRHLCLQSPLARAAGSRLNGSRGPGRGTMCHSWTVIITWQTCREPDKLIVKPTNYLDYEVGNYVNSYYSDIFFLINFVAGSKTVTFILWDFVELHCLGVFWWTMLILAQMSCSDLRIAWRDSPAKNIWVVEVRLRSF